jgi:hypothetical protein
MNEDYDMELFVDAVPDDLEQYLKNIELMKRLIRINRAVETFSDGFSFKWYYDRGSVLPNDQSKQIYELLDTAHGLQFSSMDSNVKQILWKAVRFYYGLSQYDFPFPDELKDKPKRSRESRGGVTSGPYNSTTRQPPLLPALFLAVSVAFVLGLVIGSGIGARRSTPQPSFPTETILPLPHADKSAANATPEPTLRYHSPRSQPQH